MPEGSVPETGRRLISGDWIKWLTPAAGLLVVAGGYGVFSHNPRDRLGVSRPDPQIVTAAEPVAKRTDPTIQRVAVPAEGSRRLDPAASAVPSVGPDGLYAGPMCYGPTPADPPRCFRAHAMVTADRIAGRWPGRAPGVTMVMAGEGSTGGGGEKHRYWGKAGRARPPPPGGTGEHKEGGPAARWRAQEGGGGGVEQGAAPAFTGGGQPHPNKRFRAARSCALHLAGAPDCPAGAGGLRQ